MSNATTSQADATLSRPDKAPSGISAMRLASSSPAQGPIGRDASLDYLRAFITMLVVAHHSVLAYALISPSRVPRHPAHPWVSGIPIFEPHRLLAFDLFGLFNDIFFMALMFFIAGLFTWPSIIQKGGKKFLRDRGRRLGLPFIVFALLAPLSFYPAYLANGRDPSLAGFLHDWLSLASPGAWSAPWFIAFWPSGPLWFVWVLLLFDAAAAAIYCFAPRFAAAVCQTASGASRRPAVFFAVFMAIAVAAYQPMLIAFGPTKWISVGPFSFQASRILFYFVFFLAGCVAGSGGVERGLLAQHGRLASRWPVWALAAAALYLPIAALSFLRKSGPAGDPPLIGLMIYGPVFVLCCGAIGFAFLALFRRFAVSRCNLLDSLSHNAYGIYLIHYGFVLWVQYTLLPWDLPPVAKAAVAFLGALILSWGMASALRRIPAVARVI